MSGISWRNLSTKLEAFAASRRSPASSVVTPPCMTGLFQGVLGAKQSHLILSCRKERQMPEG